MLRKKQPGKYNLNYHASGGTLFQVLTNRKAPVMRKEERKKNEMSLRGLEITFRSRNNRFLIELTKGSNGL